MTLSLMRWVRGRPRAQPGVFVADEDVRAPRTLCEIPQQIVTVELGVNLNHEGHEEHEGFYPQHKSNLIPDWTILPGKFFRWK